eukprot:gene17860-8784_t
MRCAVAAPLRAPPAAVHPRSPSPALSPLDGGGAEGRGVREGRQDREGENEWAEGGGTAETESGGAGGSFSR